MKINDKIIRLKRFSKSIFHCERRVAILVTLVLVMGFSLVPAISATADTSVSGDITSDTTWNVAGSPYIVTNNVTVGAGVTLTIDPGVTVKFNDAIGLICDGILSAVGTDLSGILFTTSQVTPPESAPYTVWNGIYLQGAGASGSHLEYCTVEYGITSEASIQVGSSIAEVDDVVISHCTLRKGGLPSMPWDPGVGIYLIGKHATVTYNDITECIKGIEFKCPNTLETEKSSFSHNEIYDVGSPTGQGNGIFFYSSGYCDIDYNEIHNGNFSGIWHDSTGMGDGHINFRNNDISGGSGHGIQADGRVPYITIQDNIIDNCPGNANYRGIFVQGLGDTVADHIVVSGNTIKNNKWGLEVRPDGCTIEHNNFENITDGALMNSIGSYTSPSLLTAQSNWWGNASGPNDPNDADPLSDNPSGTGCPLYPEEDNVNYNPWYTDAAMTTLSNEAEITSYKFEAAKNTVLDSDVTGTIDSDNHTIALTVLHGTDVTALVATFEFSAGATAKVGETAQVSETTPNDFSSSVTYVITSLDEITTQNWVVTVTITAPCTDATLSDLTVDGTTISGFSSSIFTYNKVLPYGTETVPTVAAIPTDSKATVDITQATNLTGTEAKRTATVVVTAEDSTTTKIYKIIFGSIKVTITKTGPATANQGNNITYTITYKNEGTFDATNVVVTETYPSEVSYVSAIPVPDTGTNNQWTIGTLAPGAEGTITVTVHIK